MNKETDDIKVIEIAESGPPGISIATTSFHADHNKAKNLAKMINWIKMAGGKGASLLIFPEQSLQGYISFAPTGPMPLDEFNYHYDQAETIPGPSTDTLTVLAREHNMCIVVGMTERNDEYAGGTGALFNSLVLIGHNGVIGIHRKVHLPGNEDHIYIRGAGFNVYDTPIGRIGMHICHDKSFPESSRELMIKGADIIVNCSAWPRGGPLTVYGVTEEEYSGYVNEIMERHSATANEVWFISSNNFGVDDFSEADYFGRSRIIHPSGLVIAESGECEAMVIAHGLDIRGEVFRKRTIYNSAVNYAKDRMPSAYSTIGRDLKLPPYIPESGTTERSKEYPDGKVDMERT